MDDTAKNLLFSLLAIGLGLLALKLPSRFNPFRLKRSVAGLLPEGANRIVPMIFGWLLITLGGLGLVAMLLIFGLERWAASEEAGRAASARKIEEEMRAEEVSLATAVATGISEADHFDLIIRDPQTGRYKDTLMNQDGLELARLKEVFSGAAVAPRTDLSSALFLVPASAISFRKSGKLATQIQLSGNLRSFNAVVGDEGTIYQNSLPVEGAEALRTILPSLAGH